MLLRYLWNINVLILFHLERKTVAKLTKKDIQKSSLVIEPWMSKSDVKLFRLADKLAVKHCAVLFQNHKKFLKGIPKVESRIGYISNIIFWLYNQISPVLRYTDSVSDRRLPTVAIEQKRIKDFNDRFLHPKTGWQYLFLSFHPKFEEVDFKTMDKDSRKMVVAFHKDVVQIATWFILFETGGYVDKRAAKQLEWI